MKNTKKLLALLLALVLALGTAACAAKEESPAPAAPEAPVEDPAEPAPEEPAEPAEPEAAPYTITVSVQAGPGVEEGWKAVAAAYQKYHPEATIKVDLKAAEGYDEWAKTIGADYKNSDVDIVNINLVGDRTKTKEMSINWNEYMEEVNPYDKEGRIWKDCFNYNAQNRDPVSGDFDALSLTSVQVAWFYNQDIFEEHGLTPPTTWDELIAVCEALDAAGIQPISIEGDYTSFYSMRMGWLSQFYADQTTRTDLEIYRAQPDDYCYDPDIDGKFVLDLTDPWNDEMINCTRNPVRFWAAVHDGTISANTPGTAAVWENFSKVFPKYAGGDAFFGCTDCLPAFYQGKAAMTCHVTGFAVEFANNMAKAAAGEDITMGDNVVEGVKPFTLGIFNTPSMTNPSGKWGPDEIFQAPARTVEVATGFLGAFSRNAEHDAQVADFMMFYSSAEGQTVFINEAMSHGWTPSGASLVDGVTYPESIEAAFSQVEWIGNAQKPYGNALARGLMDDPESTRKYYDLAQQCLTGAITPEEYAKSMAEQHMQYFEVAMPKDIAMSDLAHPELEPVGQNIAE